MAQIREIKKRLKAVGNIRRITKTMQMIATSKFARAQQRATATKPYTEGVFGLVTELAATAGNLEHPLIDGPVQRQDKELTLVLTSDRGLCGSYNSSVLRLALRHLRGSAAARDGDLELVGKKGVNFLRFNQMTPSTHHTQFGDTPHYDEVARLAQVYMDRFTAGEVSAVRVVYMRYVSAGRQRAEVLQLLPLKPPAAQEKSGADSVYEFSPEAGELLDGLLPEAVKATLFQCFNDAVVSEHVARMVAMKAATDNAGKMGKALARKFNRARQARITTELTEIISGAAAQE
ncbi:MAG: ATP synthase F1 subunit gamma [Planctomycetes bacterium]|nr:ATP synthase F1 subunit gamma [Planctomycetota bacterium]